jgi:hypothetical protein
MTGLGRPEIAALRAVERECGVLSYASMVPVLSRLDDEEGLSPAYALHILRDLGDNQRVNTPLVRHQGDWEGDPDDFHARAQITKVQLTRMGGVVLAAEQGNMGFTPMFLLNGSLYCGGVMPAFAPHRMFHALRLLIGNRATSDDALFAAAGAPSLPSGEVVEGSLERLYHGHRVPMTLGCTFERTETLSGLALDITGMPTGVTIHRLKQELTDSIGAEEFREDDSARALVTSPESHRKTPCPINGFEDWTSSRSGVRLRLFLAPNASHKDAERWVREECESACVELDVELPAPLAELLRLWAESLGHDMSQLDAIVDLERQDRNQRYPQPYCTGTDQSGQA